LAFFDAVVRNLEAQGVPTERALREAAAAARQLTTNFAKGGEMKTAFNTFYLFFNASLQGSMAMFTSLVNNPKGRKLVAGVITAGFVMELLNGAISGDEDDDGIKDYDNLGDYELSHSIVLPDLNGDGTFDTESRWPTASTCSTTSVASWGTWPVALWVMVEHTLRRKRQLRQWAQ
jgi:hypothetical protein